MKSNILNTAFNPNVIKVYVDNTDNSYSIYTGTEEFTSYEQCIPYCFVRQETSLYDDTTYALENAKCFIYDSETGYHVESSERAIGTTNQFNADRSKRYKLLYLKQN